MSQQLKEKNIAEVAVEKLSHFEVLLDNETTKITFHHIRPGEQSGWHLHDTNYVGYHINTGKMRYERADGSNGEIQSQAGKAFYYDVAGGFEHNVTNVGDTDVVGLEIEYKKYPISSQSGGKGMSQHLEEKNVVEIPTGQQSHYEILLDNDTTRITFHRIRPGQQSGWHVHDTNYVGYHIEAAKLQYERADGSVGEIESQPGKSFFYDVGEGFEHNVTNIGDTDMVALEIEYKKG